MAAGQTYTEQLGGKPKPISASGVIGGRYPPLAGCMLHCMMPLRTPDYLCSGPSCGELSGGNWMVVSFLRGDFGSRDAICCDALAIAPSPLSEQLYPSGSRGVLRDPPLKIVTWLILPVVICLSQRLSHACLSISNLYCETANGSLNQLSFI
jgi:hypothetical protein